MNDRLGELGVPDWVNESGDIEMATTTSPMEHFFRQVDSMKTDIEVITAANRTIRQINEQSMAATSTEEERALSNQLRKLLTATNERAKQTKFKLEQLKFENKRIKAEGCVQGSDWRVRDNLCNTLTRKFIDEMKAYQSSQQKYRTDIKTKVKRQVQIVKPDATDEEIDTVMKSDGGRDALYKESILAGGVNSEVQTAYTSVAGKYQDVLTLESSVAELHQMFLDFALLTDQQGEVMDQIEQHLKTAVDHVEDGNGHIHEATKYQLKIRKKQCWILLIVAIVVTVLVVAFVLRLASGK